MHPVAVCGVPTGYSVGVTGLSTMAKHLAWPTSHENGLNQCAAAGGNDRYCGIKQPGLASQAATAEMEPILCDVPVCWCGSRCRLAKFRSLARPQQGFSSPSESKPEAGVRRRREVVDPIRLIDR